MDVAVNRIIRGTVVRSEKFIVNNTPNNSNKSSYFVASISVTRPTISISSRSLRPSGSRTPSLDRCSSTGTISRRIRGCNHIPSHILSVYTSREKCRFVRLLRIEPTLGTIFRFESREERRDEGGKGGGEEGQGKDCGNRASDAALVEGRPENLRPGIHPFSDIPRQQGNFLGCTSPVHQDGHGSLRIHYSRSVKLFITSRIRSWRPGERRPRT